MPLLQVQQLTRTFGGLTAVSALDLAVDDGELVSVIGPNGAGKTTLFNLITGLDVPDAGQIMLDGQPIAGLPPARVAVCSAT
jgi:branched-chain amino acid transport system ATP-binding protein